MRKGISQSYIDFVLASGNTRVTMAHLYQFTSLAGDNDYFCDLDIDITYNAVIWKASSLRIDGLRRKTSVGLNVDEQSVKIYALPTDTLFGADFLTAAESGILDGCRITRYRAVWPPATGNAIVDVTANAPLQVWTMFTGYASKIEKGGQTRIEMKIKSPFVKLEISMPRNYYQPGCLWTLFDTGCTLNKASYAVSGTAAAGGTTSTLPVAGGIATPVGGDGYANYAQGRILFTSGDNDGLLTLIYSNDASNLYLAYPLEVAPSIGDTFTFYPGCSKSFFTCKSKFGNEANIRSFDLVPPISISI